MSGCWQGRPLFVQVMYIHLYQSRSGSGLSPPPEGRDRQVGTKGPRYKGRDSPGWPCHTQRASGESLECPGQAMWGEVWSEGDDTALLFYTEMLLWTDEIEGKVENYPTLPEIPLDLNVGNSELTQEC